MSVARPKGGRMQESGPYGPGRGALSHERPYRNL